MTIPELKTLINIFGGEAKVKEVMERVAIIKKLEQETIAKMV